MDRDFEPKLLLFLSVDVVGSTDFKNKHPDTAKIQPWLPFFEDFYETFPIEFNKKCDDIKKSNTFCEVIRNHSDEKNFYPKLWKCLGDELIFFQKLSHYMLAVFYVVCFMETIKTYYGDFIKGKGLENLKLKATAWVAGFPVINAEIKLKSNDGRDLIDFIGPSIDIGFRLSKFSSPEKFVVSVDLAYLLSYAITSDYKYSFFYDGRVPLKGVLNDFPYPMIWISMSDLEDEIDGKIKNLRNREEIQAFTEKYIDKAGEKYENNVRRPIIRPFIEGDEKFHKKPDYYPIALDEIKKFHQEKRNPEKIPEPEKLKDASSKIDMIITRLKESLK